VTERYRGVNPGKVGGSDPQILGRGRGGRRRSRNIIISYHVHRYRKYVWKWWLLKRNKIIWPEVAVNGQVLPVKLKCFVRLPENIEIFRKFASKNRITLPGSTTTQISNQIDAAEK